MERIIHKASLKIPQEAEAGKSQQGKIMFRNTWECWSRSAKKIAGFSGHLQKPVSSKELGELLVPSVKPDNSTETLNLSVLHIREKGHT